MVKKNPKNKTVKKNQTEILELKNLIITLKNSIQSFSIRHDQVDESVNLKTSHLKSLRETQRKNNERVKKA